MALQVLEQLESLRGSVSQAPQLPAPDFRFEKDIKLVDVCFRYPCSETDSLHRVNLHIAKGEKVGLIGPSGAGKARWWVCCAAYCHLQTGKSASTVAV